MKSYKDVTNIIAAKAANSQFHAYMSGNNQYEVILTAYAEVIALTFGRSYVQTARTLKNQVEAKFNSLLKKQAHNKPSSFDFVDGA